MTEVSRKIERVRERLKALDAEAIRLRGLDWIAWVTGGADVGLIANAETGVAEVLITRDRALVLTTASERERMAVEIVPREFEIVSLPWTQERAFDEFSRSLVGSTPLLSDRPEAPGEVPMERDWLSLRLQLSTRECARLLELGADLAKAVTRTLKAAQGSWRELDLAAFAYETIVACDIEPVLLLAGGEGRIARHHSPVASQARLGGRALLIVCGRRSGLHASLARHVFFRAPTSQETINLRAAALIESEALAATADLRPLPDIYRRLKAKYVEMGLGHEIERHPQGGATGYRPREDIARPMGSVGVKPQLATAFAWSPSVEEERLEDTYLLGSDGRLVMVTNDPEWPVFEIDGRMRPGPLLKTDVSSSSLRV